MRGPVVPEKNQGDEIKNLFTRQCHSPALPGFMAEDHAHPLPPSDLCPCSSGECNCVSGGPYLQLCDILPYSSWSQSHPDRHQHVQRLFRFQEWKRSPSQTPEPIRWRRTNPDRWTSKTVNPHSRCDNMPCSRQLDRTLLHLRPVTTLPVHTRIGWSNLHLRVRRTSIPSRISWSRRTNCRTQLRPGYDSRRVLCAAAHVRNSAATRLDSRWTAHSRRPLDQRIPRHGRRQRSRKENSSPETWIRKIHHRLRRNGNNSVHSHSPLCHPRNLLPRHYEPHFAHCTVESALRRKSDQNSPGKLQGPTRNNSRECEHDISPPILRSLGDSRIRPRGSSRTLTLCWPPQHPLNLSSQHDA